MAAPLSFPDGCRYKCGGHAGVLKRKSPSANAPAFADGDYRYIAPARCHVSRGSYMESSEGLPRGSILLIGFLVFENYVFTEVLLRIVVGFKKSIICKRAYRVLLRSLRPSLEESSRSRCSPPAPPLARDAIACSALEERAVYFISLSRRTLSTVLSSSSGERKWHPFAENVRPARVRQQLCPGVG